MEWNGMATIRREPTTLSKAFMHPFVGVSKFHIHIYLLFWDIYSKTTLYSQSNVSRIMSHVYSFFARVCFFSVTKKPLFGLQACVGNYQKITNTNATANNPPIYKNKGRHYFCNAIIITVYSIRRIRTSIAK